MKKFNKKTDMRTKKYTESEVQIIVNLVCEELEIPNCVIYPISNADAKHCEKSTGCKLLGQYAGFDRGCYRIELTDETNLKTALHEVAHHYQELKTAFADGTHTHHDSTFTTGCKNVTKAMKRIFGEDWVPEHQYLR